MHSRLQRAQPLSLLVLLRRTLMRPMPPLVDVHPQVRSVADSARADSPHGHAIASSAITRADDAVAVAVSAAAIRVPAVLTDH